VTNCGVTVSKRWCGEMMRISFRGVLCFSGVLLPNGDATSYAMWKNSLRVISMWICE
jgi:hypothetical protein